MSDRLGSLVSRELIDELQTLFPNRCIQRGMTLEEAHRESGQQELIDKLNHALSEYTANLSVLGNNS